LRKNANPQKAYISRQINKLFCSSQADLEGNEWKEKPLDAFGRVQKMPSKISDVF